MLDKKLDFSTGGWLIGGRPTGLFISGDHLFLNYIFFLGNGGWLIGRGLLILTWHYLGSLKKPVAFPSSIASWVQHIPSSLKPSLGQPSRNLLGSYWGWTISHGKYQGNMMGIWWVNIPGKRCKIMVWWVNTGNTMGNIHGANIPTLGI